MAHDFIIQRIRESLLRMDRTPERVGEPYETAEQDIRDSIQYLSRSRVSSILRQLRAACGFSYAQVQLDTGLSQQFLFDVEFKDRCLTLDELRTLADCYQVGVGDILGIDID